jgi:phenylalanyl-tRNA synthetase beta chain
MFSQYCANKFQVEPVQVTQYNGQTTVYPLLDNRLEIIDANEVNRKIGTNIDEEKMVNLLSRMGLSSRTFSEKKIEVTIPVTRSDILHACDIIEDIAIGYGFNNIQKTIPKTDCFSNEVLLFHQIKLFFY